MSAKLSTRIEKLFISLSLTHTHTHTHTHTYFSQSSFQNKILNLREQILNPRFFLFSFFLSFSFFLFFFCLLLLSFLNNFSIFSFFFSQKCFLWNFFITHVNYVMLAFFWQIKKMFIARTKPLNKEAVPHNEKPQGA